MGLMMDVETTGHASLFHKQGTGRVLAEYLRGQFHPHNDKQVPKKTQERDSGLACDLQMQTDPKFRGVALRLHRPLGLPRPSEGH